MSFQFGVIRGDLNCRGYWQAVGVALPKIKNLKKPNLTFQNNNLTIRQAQGTTLSRNRVIWSQSCFSRKSFSEIKFFSASPRLRGALVSSGFSPCLSTVACPQVRRRVVSFGCCSAARCQIRRTNFGNSGSYRPALRCAEVAIPANYPLTKLPIYQILRRPILLKLEIKN